LYHGKVILPLEYPLKPPDIIFLTPNGRFEVGKKICLTISSHHAESWRPSWSVRTALLAIIAFMPTRGDGAIASLDWPAQERKRLATQSLAWKCSKCNSYNLTALPTEDRNETLDNIQLLENFRIKNKEEQERDEREKKEREEKEKGCQREPIGEPDSQHQPDGTQPPNTVPPAQIHQRHTTPTNYRHQPAEPIAFHQPPPQSSSLAQCLDIAIVIFFFAIVGLLMQKYAL